MRKLISLLAITALTAVASWAVNVNNTAGGLSNVLTDKSITSLTVTGTMDARDFKYIADYLDNLTEVDLSGVSIVAYENLETPVFGSQLSYEANTIPQTSFFGKPLSKVTLPSDLKTIGYAAFCGCSSLKTILLPASLDSISSFAFSATGLTGVALSETVTKMGEGAYSKCTSLTSVWVAAGNVGNYAFYGCTALSDLTIGAKVTEIGKAAFGGCTALKAVNWTTPSSVTKIGDRAFALSSITSANIASLSKLNSLGAYAYTNSAVTSVTLPESVAEVGEGAFYYATKLTSVVLPTRVTAAPAYMAAGTALANPDVLGSGVEEVGDYAFYNVPAQSFTIPSNVQYIGTQAMAGMTGLQAITARPRTVPELGDDVWAGVNQPAVELTVNVDGYDQAEQWKEFKIVKKLGLLGDANGDGVVNVSDITAVINYILGMTSSNFVFDNADVNEDGVINVSDITGIINIILTSGAPVKPDQYDVTDDNFAIDNFSMRPGETRTIELKLNNATAYTSVQCDIQLPAGLELVDGTCETTSRDAEHNYQMGTVDGAVRVVGYNLSNAAISGNEGAVITFTVKASDNLAVNSQLTIDNVVLATANGETYYAAPTVTKVGNTTGINDMVAQNAKVYTRGSVLVIESPEATMAQFVAVDGRFVTLAVNEGVNEYDALGTGIYIVNIAGKSHKIVLK